MLMYELIDSNKQTIQIFDTVDLHPVSTALKEYISNRYEIDEHQILIRYPLSKINILPGEGYEQPIKVVIDIDNEKTDLMFKFLHKKPVIATKYKKLDNTKYCLGLYSDSSTRGPKVVFEPGVSMKNIADYLKQELAKTLKLNEDKLNVYFTSHSHENMDSYTSFRVTDTESKTIYRFTLYTVTYVKK